jgi:hypothetical protein
MRRQQRADRLEAEVLAQLERRHDSSYAGGYVPSSPRTWDAARFSAVQRQQARLDRTLFKLLGELGRLEPADAEGEDEEPPNEPRDQGEEQAPNEPGRASATDPANDDEGKPQAENEKGREEPGPVRGRSETRVSAC